MKKIFITLLFLSAFSNTAYLNSSPITANIENKKTLNTDLFKINYPSDWELDESGKMGTSFSFTAHWKAKQHNIVMY